MFCVVLNYADDCFLNSFDPFWAMISLATSYFFAEMWFGIVFAVIVEIVPMEFRSSVVGVFMFVINNVGGNLPILVDPLAKEIGYRGAIAIFYAGFYLVSKYCVKIIILFKLKSLSFFSFRFNSLLLHNVLPGRKTTKASTTSSTV